MATSHRCLCFVLTAGMVALRPSTTIRTESPNSAWWGTKESKQLQNSARRLVSAGEFSAAEAVFERGAQEASQQRDPVATARYLSGAAGARMARFEYRGALSAYLQARQAAQSAGDPLDLGAIELNLSSLYRQVWDLDSSRRAAEEGIAAAGRIERAYYLPQLYLQLGQVHIDLEDADPVPFYEKGIQAAQDENNPALESRGWDLLGQRRMAQGDLEGAQQAFLHAYFLRRLAFPRDLSLSYLRLGELRLAQAETFPDSKVLLRQGERFTKLAQAAQPRGRASLPAYVLRHQLGEIRLAQGRISEALDDLEAAVEMAGEWRAGIPPAISSLDGAGAELETRIFSDFIQAAADYGLRTGNRAWIERSFLAAELSRAASLKDRRALAGIWQRKLPLEFWETMSKLRAEDVRLMRVGARNSPLSDRLNLKLTEMEAKAGLGFSSNLSEKFGSRHSLTLFQRGLRDSEVVLSFFLGQRESFLWAVSRNRITAYRLAPRDRIGRAVRDFREAVETGKPGADILGERLYGMLFGQLGGEGRRADWLLSVEDTLLELPFAALAPERQGDKPVYLAEEHSVRIIPGIFLLRGASGRSGKQPRFLGVADPVYNTADPRWRGRSSWFTAPVSGQLNRLPGTRAEVESSARVWTSQMGPEATVLEGSTATRANFLQSLDPAPSIIHLATHVLTPAKNREQAFLAFGVDRTGRPELLAASDVAMLRVPEAVVVMTGCATAAGSERPGESLEGLTRAWTIAGARAVIATEWPVPDSTGKLLSSFYTHLREFSPAEALRRSQAEAIRSGGAPASWASFQVFGGEL